MSYEELTPPVLQVPITVVDGKPSLVSDPWYRFFTRIKVALGYIFLRRLSQSAIPTPTVGELMIHRDTDDSKTYLVYNDPDEGVRKVELT